MTAPASDTPPGEVAPLLTRALHSPAAWHAATLLGGFVFIMWLQRSQWFFLDEWAFLEPNHLALMAPHVGHWSTSPLLVFLGIQSVFGMGSYLPFALIVTLIHVAIVHLTWRICLRSRVDPWIATASVSVLLVLGAGSENILWAFQIGFLGALALGLLAFLLAMRPRISMAGHVLIVAIALFALTWSGTAIPLVMATTAMIWRRNGLRRSLSFAAMTAAVYLTWYITFALGSDTNPDTGGFGLTKIFVKVPEFIGVMLILGFQKVFPVPGLGVVVLVVLCVWLNRLRMTRTSIRDFSPALILTAAAAAFAFMTAFSRAEFSLGGGRSSRYVYLLVVLLLPLCGVALTRLAATKKAWRASVFGVLAILAVYQGAVLVSSAKAQSDNEMASQRLISAAISLSVAEPAIVNPLAVVDTSWAPDVTLADLVELHDRGILPVGDFGSEDMKRARAAVTQ